MSANLVTLVRIVKWVNFHSKTLSFIIIENIKFSSNSFYIWAKIFFLRLVDCVWGEWSKGSCSSSCGKATRTSTRIKIVKEVNGGNCEGKSTKTEFCKVPPCPGN